MLSKYYLEKRLFREHSFKETWKLFYTDLKGNTLGVTLPSLSQSKLFRKRCPSGLSIITCRPEGYEVMDLKVTARIRYWGISKFFKGISKC